MKQNYRFIIMYDGSRYYGWQRQPDHDTVQGKLEAVLERMCGRPVEIIGAGRTDAGAIRSTSRTVDFFIRGFTQKLRKSCSPFRISAAFTAEEIRDYLNRYLPEDIGVREVKAAGPRFHARYNALGKTYRYTCFDGPVKPVFDRKYVYVLEETPDMDAMREAAEILKGEHDFRNFTSLTPMSSGR